MLINTKLQTCQNKPHQHFLAEVLDRQWLWYAKMMELLGPRLEKPQEFSSQLTREGSWKGKKCPCDMRNRAQSGPNVECKGRGLQRASDMWDPGPNSQRLEIWGPWFFSVVFFFSPSVKAHFDYNFPLEGQHWVLLTNHLFIQQYCEVDSCQHTQLQTKAICRGDTKYPCLEMNLLAFWGQISSGLQLLNSQSKDGGTI